MRWVMVGRRFRACGSPPCTAGVCRALRAALLASPCSGVFFSHPSSRPVLPARTSLYRSTFSGDYGGLFTFGTRFFGGGGSIVGMLTTQRGGGSCRAPLAALSRGVRAPVSSPPCFCPSRFSVRAPAGVGSRGHPGRGVRGRAPETRVGPDRRPELGPDELDPGNPGRLFPQQAYGFYALAGLLRPVHYRACAFLGSPRGSPSWHPDNEDRIDLLAMTCLRSSAAPSSFSASPARGGRLLGTRARGAERRRRHRFDAVCCGRAGVLCHSLGPIVGAILFPYRRATLSFSPL